MNKLGHLVFCLSPVPIGKLIAELLQRDPLFLKGFYHTVRPDNRILMPGFTLEKNILDLSVCIPVHRMIGSYHLCCNFSLHRAGLSGISTDIIQLVPLHQILPYRLTVKEYNRYIFVFGHLNDVGRLRPVNQIDHKDITACIKYFLYHLVLKLLVILTIPYRHDDFQGIGLIILQILLQTICKRINKGIILCIKYYSDPENTSLRFLVAATSCQT